MLRRERGGMRKRVAKLAQPHCLVWRRQRQFRRKTCLRHRRHPSSLLIFDLFTYNRVAHKGLATDWLSRQPESAAILIRLHASNGPTRRKWPSCHAKS
jgi:hypothetical protein